MNGGFINPLIRYLLLPLVLILLSSLIYSNSLHGDFLFDDTPLVLQNPQFSSITSLSSATLPFAGQPRSILMMSYGLNRLYGGTDPYLYHLTNLFTHVLNSLLVYLILLQLVESTLISWIGASLFTSHPLATSAVAYIAGRSSLLCATFYLLAILSLLLSRRYSGWVRTSPFLLLTIASAYLSWQTKQEAITLPLFLAAILWVYRSNLRCITLYASIPLLAVVYLRNSLSALYSSTAANTILVNAGFSASLSPGLYLRSYITNLVGYYYPKFLFPTHLSADPEVIISAHWYSPEFITSALVIIVLISITFYYRRLHPLLSLSLAALLISPLSAYALIPLADPIQEHRAYISLLFTPLFLIWLLTLPRLRQYASHLSLPLILVSSLAAHASNLHWSSPLTLWSNAVAQAPNSFRPHFNLGTALDERRDFPNALAQYAIAIRLDPTNMTPVSNSAGIYLNQRQYALAESLSLKVVTTSPKFTEGWINLAVIYIRTNRLSEAIRILRTYALPLNSESYPAHYNLAEALRYAARDRAGLVESLSEYRLAQSLRPDFAVVTTQKITDLESVLAKFPEGESR